MRNATISLIFSALLFPMHAAFAADPVSFQDDVHPILAERCFECHAADERKGGLSMNTRELFLEGGEFGPVVELGNSEESVLIELVTSEDDKERMPSKGDPLSPEEIDILARWIDSGLDWTYEGPQPGDLWEAPIKLQPVKILRAKGIHGSSNLIDKLLAEYFDENDIGTPERISDRQYIRRAFMDLIGLLPPTESVDNFVTMPDDDKYEELVKHLLADDRSYAEHWMTFWNDALRNDYKGTGYIDGGRKAITGWLYRQLEKNTPYDKFARDLIAPRPPAEGFIKGIKWRGAETANQQIPLQAARSVSQVFLGINMKCASCHDSFVNQWKLDDAYGLASAFSSEPIEIARCDSPTGKVAETKFLWPELGSINPEATLDERRDQVADLVTMPENGWFARTIVNRIWKETMGRGLVEPLDSMDAKPWSPELLDALAAHFQEIGYDTRELLKLIVTSEAYRLQPDTNPPTGSDYTFRGPIPRRLTVEQFYDAMGCVTNVWQAKAETDPREQEGSLSEGTVRAWRSIADPMMLALGRPNREQIMLARETDYTRLHALELTNGDTLAAYLNKASEGMLAEGPVKPAAVFEHALGRPANPTERSLLASFGNPITDAADVEDVLWLIFNHPEFQIVF